MCTESVSCRVDLKPPYPGPCACVIGYSSGCVVQEAVIAKQRIATFDQVSGCVIGVGQLEKRRPMSVQAGAGNVSVAVMVDFEMGVRPKPLGHDLAESIA